MDRRDFLKKCVFISSSMFLPSCSITGARTKELPGTGIVRRRRLGKTDIMVSELGFGSHLTEENIADPRGREEQILYALERGVNLYDIYESQYRQYEPMSKIIKPRRKKFLISLSHFKRVKSNDPEEARKVVMEEIEESLKIFHTEVIDLFRMCYNEESKMVTEIYETISKARKQGKVRAI